LADLDAGIVNLGTTKKQTDPAAAKGMNRYGAWGEKTSGNDGEKFNRQGGWANIWFAVLAEGWPE
jgi:hypothetical protein